MIDKEHLEYIINEINEDIDKPFHMANEGLVDELFPYLEKEFPGIKLVKYEVNQWIVVTPLAVDRLREKLSKKLVEHAEEITKLTKIINKLGNNNREEWHKSENHTIVEKDSSDWKIAEQYRRYHENYYNEIGAIKEVWRDKNGFLCVQYVSDSGELLNWFHYTIDDNDITWW